MPPRLLLVEDDPTTRAFLVAAGETLPAVIDTADCLSAARSLAVAHDYALWLIDAHLPDGSGASLLSWLRAQGLHTPALAHTAAQSRDDVAALLAEGFVAVVVKPLAADAWRTALRDALAGRGASDPGRVQAATPTAHRDLPLWDDAAALAAMNGQRAHVDALRGLFRAELPASRAALEAAFATGDEAALGGTLHKLRASCGFVGARRLDAACIALHAHPHSEAARRAVIAALQDTLSS